jgi:hypothetical protein
MRPGFGGVMIMQEEQLQNDVPNNHNEYQITQDDSET